MTSKKPSEAELIERALKVCKVENCSTKHHCKGYCSKHYQQSKRNGELRKRDRKSPNEIILNGEQAEIVLYDARGNETSRALIDVDDVEKVKNHRWSKNGDNYVFANISGKKTRLHRLIAHAEKGLLVDHINFNKLDNRKDNLRLCSHKENNRNNRSKGVFFDKSKSRHCSQITVDGKRIKRYFQTEQEAVSCRRKMEEMHFGEFACRVPIESR